MYRCHPKVNWPAGETARRSHGAISDLPKLFRRGFCCTVGVFPVAGQASISTSQRDPGELASWPRSQGEVNKQQHADRCGAPRWLFAPCWVWAEPEPEPHFQLPHWTESPAICLPRYRKYSRCKYWCLPMQAPKAFFTRVSLVWDCERQRQGKEGQTANTQITNQGKQGNKEPRKQEKQANKNQHLGDFTVYSNRLSK